MVPVVVVDVVPADAPADHAKLMIDACSQAVRRGGCTLSSASPESTRPESVALVLWQGQDFLHVSIRVNRGDGEWASRQIDFSDGDALTDRWTAVGLTVATLVDETRSAPARGGPPASKGEPAAGSPAGSPAPGPVEGNPSGRPKLAFSLGGLTGTGWDQGGWQRGLWASAAASWPKTPLFGLVSASYGWSDGPELGASGMLESRWYGVSLAAGLETVLRPIDLRLYAAPEIALQSVTATLTGSDGKLTDREVRLRLRGGIVWPARGPVGVMIGGTLRLLPPGGGDPAANRARSPGVAAELLGGLELRL